MHLISCNAMPKPPRAVKTAPTYKVESCTVELQQASQYVLPSVEPSQSFEHWSRRTLDTTKSVPPANKTIENRTQIKMQQVVVRFPVFSSKRCSLWASVYWSVRKYCCWSLGSKGCALDALPTVCCVDGWSVAIAGTGMKCCSLCSLVCNIRQDEDSALNVDCWCAWVVIWILDRCLQ